jgi:hypothetical protein
MQFLRKPSTPGANDFSVDLYIIKRNVLDILDDVFLLHAFKVAMRKAYTLNGAFLNPRRYTAYFASRVVRFVTCRSRTIRINA